MTSLSATQAPYYSAAKDVITSKLKNNGIGTATAKNIALSKLWKKSSLGGEKTASNRHICGKAQMSQRNVANDKFNKMQTQCHSIEWFKYLTF